MKALIIAKHKIHLTNILLKIYKNSILSSRLGFKGGTAAMLFYGLPRFSVDLDFDLIGSVDGVVEEMKKLLASEYEIVDYSAKFNTLFWAISYGTGMAKIKVEISTRDNSYNHYKLMPFYGTTIKAMVIEDMMAHKLVAVTERTSIANRDLFDIHYFLSSSNAADINYEVIKKRTGKEPSEFYEMLLKFMMTLESGKILEGLGEVLTEPQKDWAKVKLIPELKGLVEKMRDNLIH